MRNFFYLVGTIIHNRSFYDQSFPIVMSYNRFLVSQVSFIFVGCFILLLYRKFIKHIHKLRIVDVY